MLSVNISARNARNLAMVFCLLSGSISAFSQTSAQPKRLSKGVLGHLLGTWAITGTTLGKPTLTGAQVVEAFSGSFLDLHIEDPAKKDRYEARVFLGAKQDGSLVVHWLDATGADTSQTLGTGSVAGNVVSLVFPYPEGTFRDKLTYDPVQDRWRLFIEMGPADHPKVFSDWYFSRKN